MGKDRKLIAERPDIINIRTEITIGFSSEQQRAYSVTLHFGAPGLRESWGTGNFFPPLPSLDGPEHVQARALTIIVFKNQNSKLNCTTVGLPLFLFTHAYDVQSNVNIFYCSSVATCNSQPLLNFDHSPYVDCSNNLVDHADCFH